MSLFQKDLYKLFLIPPTTSSDVSSTLEEHRLKDNLSNFLSIFKTQWVDEWQNQQTSELVSYLLKSDLPDSVQSLVQHSRLDRDHQAFAFRVLGQVVDQKIPQFLLNNCGIEKIQQFHAFYVAYQPGSVFTKKNNEILKEFQKIQ